jgi:hypothetical protein
VFEKLEGQCEDAENHCKVKGKGNQGPPARRLAEAEGLSREDDLGQRQRFQQGQAIPEIVDLILFEDQPGVKPNTAKNPNRYKEIATGRPWRSRLEYPSRSILPTILLPKLCDEDTAMPLSAPEARTRINERVTVDPPVR